MLFDVQADWGLNLFCNFDCRYCCLKSQAKHDPAFKGQDPERIVHAFNATGLTWLIHASGGEPFFQPGFVGLCQALLERHYLSVNSNLSTASVHRFAEEVDPGRVAFLNCSLHIEERRARHLVEDFIEKYHHLRQRGFRAWVSQVMYPPVLKDFGRLFESFRERGVAVRPKVFRGYWRLRLYPAAYSETERRLILHYLDRWEAEAGSQDLPRFLLRDDEFLGGQLSFRGLPCQAGQRFVRIDPAGNVKRCLGERGVRLGNIFEGNLKLFAEPRPCAAQVCPCPFHGLEHAHGEPRLITDDPWRQRFSHAWRQVKLHRPGARP